MDISEEDLLVALTGRDGLFSFLQNKLNWPLEAEGADYFIYKGVEDSAGCATVKAAVSRLVPAASADTFPIFLVECSQGFSRLTLRETLRNIRQEMCKRARRDVEEVVFVCAVAGERGPGSRVRGPGAVSWGPEGSDRNSVGETQETIHRPSPLLRPDPGPRTPDPGSPTPDPYSAIYFVHYEEREGRPRVRSLGFNDREIAETHTLRAVHLPALVVLRNALDEPDWAGSKKTWGVAWDVEALTRHFFRDYQRIFDEVCNYYVKRVHGDRHLFTQRLFHRLLFIHFLSKKGWMRFQDRSDYLFALRDAADEAGENFFRDRLFWVFFQGLGLSKVPETYSHEELIEKRGDVPRLNINLFEIADRDDIHRAVFIENEAFDIILDRLFGRYNFTVFESTPDDIEVAVDLETLGRVLEKQLTGRQESGGYYMPRSFITFMCRESLKGYLATRTWERAENINAFVDRLDGDAVDDAEAMWNALKAFTCVDPACGSGAYLLGMLHELMALRQCLCSATNREEQTRYARKLEIIQQNLYGVDKDPFAVNIATLRLWLSLLVDGEVVRGEDAAVGGRGETTDTLELKPLLSDEPFPDPEIPADTWTPEPDTFSLPGLDFKIMAGDSLACPDPSSFSGQKKGYDETIRRFEEKKLLHASPQFMGNKKALLEEIRVLRSTIATLTAKAKPDFDWRVDFCDIFNPGPRTTTLKPRTPALGGFDAVLTNPPNIRHEAMGREYKEKTLKRIFPAIYNSTSDLSAYFYVRAVQLLKRAYGNRDTHDGAAGGTLAFVSSNKWFRAANGESLRQYIADHCAVQSITDFGDLPVFESASAYPVIFIAQKGGPTTEAVYTEVKSLSPPYPDVQEMITRTGRVLPENAIYGSGWNLADARAADRIRIMRAKGIPLGEYVNAKVYRGVLTSLNTAYVIDDAKRRELIAADPNSEELIKPLTIGCDINRWAMNDNNQWLIVTRMDLDMTLYPAIIAHLNGWERELLTWPDKGEEGWETRTSNYHPAFEGPKIYFQEVAAFPHFAFDCEGTYTNNEVLTIPTSDLFVLALLNSNHVWEFLQSVCPKLPNGALTLQTSSILSIPVPPASEDEKEALAEIARMCLEKRGLGVDLEEAEINRRVAALYGV